MMLLVQPVIGAGLARMAFPEENLAAWPVVFSVFLFFRSTGLALPETIIALLDGPKTIAPLRKFCLRVATGTSLALALTVLTPLLTLYLLYVLGVTPELIQFIIPGAVMGVLIPGLQAIQSWFRGVLMTGKVTSDIYWGMGINLGVVTLAVILGVLWQAPGVPVAAVALSMGLIMETIFLWRRVQPVQAGLQLLAKPMAISIDS
jgi:hypothetical protein